VLVERQASTQPATQLDAAPRRADFRPGASARDKNNLAWNLLTSVLADLRDPETALRLAGDACAMTDNANPGYLDTLALAQHRTGDTPAAIETEKKALSLLPPDASLRAELEATLARFEAALEEADTAEEPGGE
jgi:tetratricopeptide (TPR) repeat protein